MERLLRPIKMNNAATPTRIPSAIDSTKNPGMPGYVCVNDDELAVVVIVLSNGLVNV